MSVNIFIIILMIFSLPYIFWVFKLIKRGYYRRPLLPLPPRPRLYNDPIDPVLFDLKVGRKYYLGYPNNQKIDYITWNKNNARYYKHFHKRDLLGRRSAAFYGHREVYDLIRKNEERGDD